MITVEYLLRITTSSRCMFHIIYTHLNSSWKRTYTSIHISFLESEACGGQSNLLHGHKSTVLHKPGILKAFQKPTPAERRSGMGFCCSSSNQQLHPAAPATQKPEQLIKAFQYHCTISTFNTYPFLGNGLGRKFSGKPGCGNQSKHHMQQVTNRIGNISPFCIHQNPVHKLEGSWLR